MDKILQNTLNCINEGIMIANKDLKILYWNDCMGYLMNMRLEEVAHKSIYDVLPSLDKEYFKGLVERVMKNECKMFFSAAMHKDLVNTDKKLNLRISKIENCGQPVILFEFIDVTNQFLRIQQLKDYVNQLYKLNKELKEKEKVIEQLAYYDKLTGVANRTLFYTHAEKFLDSAKRNNSLMGLMFIDVNKFKSINDTYGHEAGDQVLIKVANILTQATRKNDVVARYGGDEFLILLPDIKSYHNHNVIASRIINTKNKIIHGDGEEINISLSIGVSFYPDDGENIDQIIAKADKAMYIAKKKDGQDNCFCNDKIS
ncbi:sensor domain-containing diguanylate cyclase [Petroclostridium sp. X23]|uniref:sensor domain-containing diguanylate cyclase n=1 Tax=Petroclostridium sp. X23 TaxID=3045146 RepID=UPI0024AD29F7|nr:sensor domain-containing diguanylate cyclase [Petroclostridium sp. X23]WHH59408.1 sensor domain-containing diguanylate cyclase [Petroclostridium sp. X23]